MVLSFQPQEGSLHGVKAHYKVMGLGLKTDEGGKRGNVSKIIKWILCIINSDNSFYYFGNLLWQSATKYLT